MEEEEEVCISARRKEKLFGDDKCLDKSKEKKVLTNASISSPFSYLRNSFSSPFPPFDISSSFLLKGPKHDDGSD